MVFPYQEDGVKMSIVTLDTVDSTNTYALKHFDELPDGGIVFARHQTAGRGRLGRKWFARPGESLTMSVVFKRVSEGFHGGIIVSLALLSVIEKAAPSVPVYLKWPNDLYVKNGKLGGLLCEGAHFDGGRATGVVAGVGINLNTDAGQLAETGGKATSLKIETGEEYFLDFFLSEVEKSLKREYITYSNTPQELWSRWCKKNALIGETVAVTTAAGERIEGLFQEILPDGAMRLQCSGGTRRFDCGDVSIDRTGIDWERVAERVRRQQEQNQNDFRFQ